MIKERIFIFEFVSGGGFNQVDIPASLFSEGYGMLRSIITDFKNLDFEILTLLDYRIQSFSNYLEADFITIVLKVDNFIELYKRCLKDTNYCFIIAPEFSDNLYNLTKLALDNNKKVLSIGLEGIRLGTWKLETYKFFKNNNINTPSTFLIPLKNEHLHVDFIVNKLNMLNTPIIIKPEDGVGAESIFYFENKTQINQFFGNLPENFDTSRRYILQEYIKGRDLSVSLIGPSDQKGQYPILLGINAQNINLNSYNEPSEYLGGYTPVQNCEIISEELMKIFRKLKFSQFKGYFGIDFLKTADSKNFFIEINPRLTTSYIGVRNTINKNPIELILNQDIGFLNLSDILSNNFSKFCHLHFEYNGIKSNKEIMYDFIPKLIKKIPEIVTPPIAFNNSNDNKKSIYSCFIATKTKDFKSSEKRISNILNIFKKIDFKLIKSSVLK